MPAKRGKEAKAQSTALTDREDYTRRRAMKDKAGHRRALFLAGSSRRMRYPAYKQIVYAAIDTDLDTAETGVFDSPPIEFRLGLRRVPKWLLRPPEN